MFEFESDPEGWLKKTILVPEKKIAFFVGAGISIGSGLPDFFEFSSNFISSILPARWRKSDIDEICQRLRPEVLLQVVQQIHKDRALDFYSSLESNLPNANHFFLALALKAGYCVFTTNVDTLIEQACEKINFPCCPIVSEYQYKTFLKTRSKSGSAIDLGSQLFKLHGSIKVGTSRSEKYGSIRFVLDRVGLGLTENQKKVFSVGLQDYDFIFHGYSGNDHFSVLPVILEVDSDQKIYWLKYEPDKEKPQFNKGIGYFRNSKKNLLNKALDGTSSTAMWKEMSRLWEEISILEVLSKREQSILARCRSSDIVKESLKQIINLSTDAEVSKIDEYINNPIIDQLTPKSIEYKWVKTVTDFERHLLAAMLLFRMRDITGRIEEELEQAEHYAKNDKERAEIERVRALTFSITRRLGDSESSKENLLKAIVKFESQGDFISVIEAYIELANIMRIARDFDSAKETLDKAEDILIKNRSKFQGQKRSYDWPRLMAHLLHLRGLVYGLGQRGTITEKIKGINYCDEANKFAYQAGDVTRRAAALNARGLIIYQLAERSSGLLREAESSLDNSLALSARIGDQRTSFQPLRNQLLIQLLRAMESKLYARDYWLNKAQEDCSRALNYHNLIKMSSDEPSADLIEVKYRQAQVFGLKGNKDKANKLFQEVLEYWEKKKDLHQQARIWQDLLSLADGWGEGQKCICRLLTLIESLFQSKEEQKRYSNDLLRLENIRDMLIDAYMKAYGYEDKEYLGRIVALMDQGKKIAEGIGEDYLTQDFEIWSSEHPE